MAPKCRCMVPAAFACRCNDQGPFQGPGNATSWHRWSPFALDHTAFEEWALPISACCQEVEVKATSC